MWATLWAREVGDFDPAAARRAAYTAAGGASGVLGSFDLEVRELSVPGTSVRVMPGGVVVVNRTAGAPCEAYVDALVASENLPIAATGAAARSDLIVARVEDPDNTGGPTYPAPEDPDAPPIYLRVISDVPPDSTSIEGLSADRSEYPLARIDLPAATSVVTQDLITDLRNLTNSARTSARQIQVVAGVEDRELAADDLLVAFPADDLVTVQVPAWATHARAVVTLTGVSFGAVGDNTGNGWQATGDTAVTWGWAGDPATADSVPYLLTSGAGVTSHTLVVVSDRQPVPTSARGTAATVTVRARRTSPGDAASLAVGASTVAAVDVEFYNDVEHAES